MKRELDITTADMKSGNYKTALTRLETRIGSPMLSDLVRGLISVIRGEGYLHIVILLLIAMMIIALGIKVFPAFIVKSRLNTFSNQLLRESQIQGMIEIDYSYIENEIDIKKQTAQEFVNVIDIKDKFLYTRDGNIISYIQINPIDINLLSKREKQNLARTLTAELTSERRSFKFIAVSRPVDISPLLTEYQNIISNTNNQKQKELLRHEMYSISNFALSGEVVERQFYIMLWEEYEEGIERDILKRAMEFLSKLEGSNIKCSILSESKIVRLCNLINNPAYVNLEGTGFEREMPFLKVDF